jgi:hypothetical protein
MYIDFCFLWCKVLDGNCKNMKNKSKRKLLLDFVASIGAMVIVILLTDSLSLISGKGNLPLFWSIITGLLAFVAVFWVLRNDCDYVPKTEHDETPEISASSAETKTLKWSTFMGLCTWQRAQEIIEKKNKGWRLPTWEEFQCRYFDAYDYDSKYWMADQRIFSRAYRKETVAGRGVKARLYLVREV